MNTSRSTQLLFPCTILTMALLAACGGGGAGGGGEGDRIISPPPSSPGEETGGTPAPAPPSTPPDGGSPGAIAFSFPSLTNARWGAEVTSAPATVQGFTKPTTVRVSGGSYSIDGGPFVAGTGTIRPGQTLRVRTHASIEPGAKLEALVDVGGLTSSFQVVTRSEPLVANKTVGGAGATHSTLAAAVASLKKGDVLDIRGGTHSAVVFDEAGTPDLPIIVRGVADAQGKRPIIQGSTSNTTVLLAESHNLVLDNLEITNGTAKPGSCLRNVAHEVVLSRVKVHGCYNHGILGADDGGSLTLDRVEVTNAGCVEDVGMNCGDDSYKHPIYVATNKDLYPNASFRVLDSYLHDNPAGEVIKTRAQHVEIRYSWIESTGKAYRALGLYGYDGPQASLQDRIDHDVVGNVLIVRGQASSVARFGGDGTGDTYGRTRFANNTVLIDENLATKRPVIQLDFIIEAFIAHNNVFSVVSARPAGAPVPAIKNLVVETERRVWADGGAPKVLMTHNYAPNGSTLLAIENGDKFDFDSLPLPSSGRQLSDWVRGDTPGLLGDLDFASLKPHPRPDAVIKAAGTRETNRVERLVPGALPQPLRNAIQPPASGKLERGPDRIDATSNPTLGALN